MRLMKIIDERCSLPDFCHRIHLPEIKGQWEKSIIPAARVRYLSEIHESIEEYNQLVKEQSSIASTLYKLTGALEEIKKNLQSGMLNCN